MADYIDREAMIEEIRFVNSLLSPENDWLHGYKTGLVAAIDAILDSNAADVVPVVRCKDCKFGDLDSEPNDAMVCMRTKDGFWRSGNDFCSYGERKGGDDNV